MNNSQRTWKALFLKLEQSVIRMPCSCLGTLEYLRDKVLGHCPRCTLVREANSMKQQGIPP